MIALPKPYVKMSKVPKWMIKEVNTVTSSIYRLNAPYAIGYAFNTASKGKHDIVLGMYISQSDVLNELYGYMFIYIFDNKTFYHRQERNF